MLEFRLEIRNVLFGLSCCDFGEMLLSIYSIVEMIKPYESLMDRYLISRLFKEESKE